MSGSTEYDKGKTEEYGINNNRKHSFRKDDQRTRSEEITFKQSSELNRVSHWDERFPEEKHPKTRKILLKRAEFLT